MKIAYPWGEPGTLLERIEGPDTWQVKFLADIGKEVRRNNFDGYTPDASVRRNPARAQSPPDIIEMAERLAAELAAKEQRERPSLRQPVHP